MIILPKLNNVKIGLELAKKGVKDAVHEEHGIVKETKRLFDDVKEVMEKGKVYTSAVTDKEAKAQIDSVADGISAYAKANNLNIIFHTPMQNEHGFNSTQKTIGVSAYSNGLFNAYTDMAIINGDVNAITKFSGDKLEAEDSFTRRVFRTVEQLTKKINEERQKDYDDSFIGSTKKGIKENLSKIADKTKNGIKKYCQEKVDFIKEEFGA